MQSVLHLVAQEDAPEIFVPLLHLRPHLFHLHQGQLALLHELVVHRLRLLRYSHFRQLQVPAVFTRVPRNIMEDRHHSNGLQII